MTCVLCKDEYPTVGRWNESKRSALEKAGWFMWNRLAPVSMHGCVLCPKCKAANPRLVAAASAPTVRT